MLQNSIPFQIKCFADNCIDATFDLLTDKDDVVARLDVDV